MANNVNAAARSCSSRRRSSPTHPRYRSCRDLLPTTCFQAANGDGFYLIPKEKEKTHSQQPHAAGPRRAAKSRWEHLSAATALGTPAAVPPRLHPRAKQRPCTQRPHAKPGTEGPPRQSGAPHSPAAPAAASPPRGPAT